MSLVQCTMGRLARFLGVRDDQVEEVVRDERHAKLTLSRRGLFTGGAAMAASTAFGFARPDLRPAEVDPSVHQVEAWSAHGALLVGLTAYLAIGVGIGIAGSDAQAATP